MSASGIVTSKQITVSYGIETELQNHFTVGASWPPGGEASFGGGKSETLKWGWTLDDHSGNTFTPASLNGSFTVVLNNTDFHNNSPSGENVQPPAPCATCLNCQRSVDTETDHVKGTCPLDGTAGGCGKPIYDCTDEEEKLQDAWHMARACTNPNKIARFLLCDEWFRHCKNDNCSIRFFFWKGHSDGSISQATAWVTNGYPESHVLDDPPDDDTELASGTSPNCASCTSTSECSTCSRDGDASASTDCASCTSTSECSACDTTETSTSTTPTAPPPPAVLTPSLSLTHNSSTSSVSMTANANAPIFGADLYIYIPDRTYYKRNKYGTKIGWTSGNSNATTYSLPVNYSFPLSAASGPYKFTLRVYPFNNSGSGDAWGDPYDVFKNVTVD